MYKFSHTSRIVTLLIAVALLLSVDALTLYKLQIIDGEKYLASSAGVSSTTTTTPAARGSILDRNGNLLVADTTVYNVKLSRSKLIKTDNPSSVILSLISAANKYGVDYNDTFPVTMSGPFSYVANMSSEQQSRLASYFEYFHIDEDISAPDLISWMRDHYEIGYNVTAEDARRIIGIRYELEIRVIVNTNDYYFANDVDIDFITYILENNFNCVTIESSSKRTYYTTYAAHLLGNVGKISATEYAEYKDQGYTLNSYIGKSGVELAFEEYLRGVDGSQTVYTDSSGAVTDIVVNSEPSPGENIQLTIDIRLQEAAENALASTIASLNAERTEDEDKAESGAVVVIDPKNGDVLAIASYPTYDLSTFNENYLSLYNDPAQPMFNRATMGKYNPGSTFKMVTALAGLNSGKITPYTTVKDEGKYTAYGDYQPVCWIYPGNHGTLNVVGALENSCNYFFYWLGDKLGADAIADTAKMFGFGSSTGIEIGDSPGIVATPEYKKETLNEGWWAADTLLSSIGQGHNMFTPIQLANYVACIANGGTLYSATVLKSISSFDYSHILYEQTPSILNELDDSNGYFSILQAGMKAVAESGTASSVFSNYKVKVAAKTGTVQSDSAEINTGVFVCYAPADDPQIAIAVVVDHGGSGSAITSTAKNILDVYFSDDNADKSITYDNSLIK